ncbi:MAG: amidohydrolase [Lachnospiraceae bacterium]
MALTAFLHGKIYTMQSKAADVAPFALLKDVSDIVMAEAMLIDGNTITAVGSDAEILAQIREISSGTGSDAVTTVDLAGRCVLPAFNDSHCHLLATGLNEVRLDLRGVRSCEEIVARGRAYLASAALAPDDWIVGYGFDQNLFDDKRLPDRSTAEAISPDRPVFLDRVCGHVGAVNRAALAIARYDENTVITGGVLARDENGKLNGILKEAALDKMRRLIPQPSPAMLEAALLHAMQDANRFGLASVQTDDLENASLDAVLAVYHKLETEGRLTLRIYEEIQQPRVPQLQEFLARRLRTGDGDDFFRIGNIKLLTDGSLGARTAYMRQPYADAPETAGVAVYTQDALNEVVALAHRNGMQVAFHAIGDGAIEQVINSVEYAGKAEAKASASLSDEKISHSEAHAYTAAASHRHRIVHCQFIGEDLLARIKDAGLCADIQPPFTASDYPIVDARVGVERSDWSYVWRTMAEAGIPLGGGSDSPVETMNPIWGIDCAVNRTDLTHLPVKGWHASQCLTVPQAISLYTRGSAYTEFSEHRKGQIAEGMLADFIVLSEDIFEVETRRIRDIQVLETYVGGRPVLE